MMNLLHAFFQATRKGMRKSISRQYGLNAGARDWEKPLTDEKAMPGLCCLAYRW